MPKYSKYRRIFLDQELSDQIIIQHDLNYFITVLKMKQNDIMRIFNNDQECLYKVQAVNKKSIIFEKLENLRHNNFKDKNNVYLCFSAFKKDTIEEIILKCTEIGIKNFIPINTDYCTLKDINKDRLNKIAIEAVEQSEQFCVPIIYNTQKLSDILNIQNANILIANEKEESNQLRDIKLVFDKTYIIIGPEGGFSEDEQQALLKFNNFTLGDSVLKSQTAAIISSFFILDLFCQV